jgi:class 3 adenylate cyclase/alpha-beta hydrolase superfamily lysophospholipase
MEVETRYARSGDVSIAYQVHGDGPLDLVLVPGFVSHAEVLWELPATARFFRQLASFSRLVIIDKRGQGLSDRLGRPPTLEESMGDVIAVMDAVEIERAALFGISEGGPMSILATATYPDRVAALILYGTYARMIEAPDYPEGMDPAVLARWAGLVERGWGGPMMSSIWAPSREGDVEFERWWARLLRQGTSPRGAIELVDLYRELDTRPALAAITAPTLVMHRAGDKVVPERMGSYLAEHIEGARYVQLPGTDHVPFTGDADGLLDEVEEFLLGSRRAREPERALATVLFTDVVGSTARAAELGDRRWNELLERHDEIVREQLRVHRGVEVKNLGDGFLATFDGPARAIRCGAAIRDRLRAAGVEARVGVHTGEVELRDGDVGGIAVHIGARVGGLAGPGEVLVSSTVKELVVGSGLDFDDRGTHELKGAPGEWHLWALAG